MPRVLRFPTLPEVCVPLCQPRAGATAVCQLENTAHQAAAAPSILPVLQIQQSKVYYRQIYWYTGSRRMRGVQAKL